jgi:hypothetical protein
MFGSLKGYKTFIVAGLAILGAVLGYLTGTLTAVQAANVILPAVIGGTLRDALNTTVGLAIEKAVVGVLESAVAPVPARLPPTVQTVFPPQPAPTPGPLTQEAQVLAPVAVDVIAAVKAIIAASETKPAA